MANMDRELIDNSRLIFSNLICYEVPDDLQIELSRHLPTQS